MTLSASVSKISLHKTLLVSLLALALIVLLSLTTGCPFGDNKVANDKATICVVVSAIEPSAQCTPVYEKGSDKPQGKFTLPNKDPAQPPSELYCSLEPKRGLKCTPLSDPEQKAQPAAPAATAEAPPAPAPVAPAITPAAAPQGK